MWPTHPADSASGPSPDLTPCPGVAGHSGKARTRKQAIPDTKSTFRSTFANRENPRLRKKLGGLKNIQEFLSRRLDRSAIGNPLLYTQSNLKFRKNQSETSYCTPKVTFPFPFEPMGSLPYSKHFHSLGCTLLGDFYTEPYNTPSNLCIPLEPLGNLPYSS